MGSNPVQAWIFFRPYFHYCLSSVQHRKDHLQIHFLNRSLHKWSLYIFTVIVPNIATQLNLGNRSFTSERNEDFINSFWKIGNVKIGWTRYPWWEWFCHAECFSSLVLGLIHIDNFRKLTPVRRRNIHFNFFHCQYTIQCVRNKCRVNLRFQKNKKISQSMILLSCNLKLGERR